MPVISKELKQELTLVLNDILEDNDNLFRKDYISALYKQLNPKRGRKVGWRKVKPVPEEAIPINNVIDN